jgi:hypothetical protein
MILKGSQRAGGQNLAVHLMRLDDNEHVRIHELRGFTCDTLGDAFKEAEAIARGTRCQKYLFSLSLNPPESANPTDQDFEAAIGRIEEDLNLSGQPRAIVIHEKNGRRHAHCVWSRIDAETMTARECGLFKNKLRDISRDLFIEHGHEMPRGLVNTAERDPTNFTLDEWQKAKRAGVDPRWIKQAVQDAWGTSDNGKSFESALKTRGLFLARGDRRAHVVLDHMGEVHALARTLGVKTKDVRARLGDGEALASVSETKVVIAEKMTPALRRHIEQSRTTFKDKEQALRVAKEKLVERQREQRAEQVRQHTQESERETKARQARMPRGFRAIWSFLTGKTAELRRQNEQEARATAARQLDERNTLFEKHLNESRGLNDQRRDMRREQAAQLMELRRDIGRFMAMTRPAHERGERLGVSPAAREAGSAPTASRARSLRLDWT